MARQRNEIYEWAWTTPQLGQALLALAQRAKLVAQTLDAPPVPAELARADADTLNRWMMLAADTLGIEAEAMVAAPHDLLDLAGSAAPALIQLHAADETGEARFLAVLE